MLTTVGEITHTTITTTAVTTGTILTTATTAQDTIHTVLQGATLQRLITITQVALTTSITRRTPIMELTTVLAKEVQVLFQIELHQE